MSWQIAAFSVLFFLNLSLFVYNAYSGVVWRTLASLAGTAFSVIGLYFTLLKFGAL